MALKPSQVRILARICELAHLQYYQMALSSPVASSILPLDKGKPVERRGRKATGLRAQAYDSGVAN